MISTVQEDGFRHRRAKEQVLCSCSFKQMALAGGYNLVVHPADTGLLWGSKKTLKFVGGGNGADHKECRGGRGRLIVICKALAHNAALQA